MSEENLAPQLSPEEIIKMGEEIYEKNLKDKLEPQMAGKFVAIEVESGKDYVENTKEEALDVIGRKTDEIIGSFDNEMEKRSVFQYESTEQIKRAKANQRRTLLARDL